MAICLATPPEPFAFTLMNEPNGHSASPSPRDSTFVMASPRRRVFDVSTADPSSSYSPPRHYATSLPSQSPSYLHRWEDRSDSGSTGRRTPVSLEITSSLVAPDMDDFPNSGGSSNHDSAAELTQQYYDPFRCVFIHRYGDEGS